STFLAFLQTIGSDPQAVVEQPIGPVVRAFNNTLWAACGLDEIEIGVTCMGIIELAFAGISAAIGRTVVERGWIAHQALLHYKLHAAIDERHADEFFSVVEPHWADPVRRRTIEQGLQLGVHIFDRLYRDLCAVDSEVR
ncbi:MAG: TenA family transcriptional regulator, partial [Gemmataceae bacterium]